MVDGLISNLTDVNDDVIRLKLQYCIPYLKDSKQNKFNCIKKHVEQ